MAKAIDQSNFNPRHLPLRRRTAPVPDEHVRTTFDCLSNRAHVLIGIAHSMCINVVDQNPRGANRCLPASLTGFRAEICYAQRRLVIDEYVRGPCACRCASGSCRTRPIPYPGLRQARLLRNSCSAHILLLIALTSGRERWVKHNQATHSFETVVGGFCGVRW
jgi:hypothetical protein